MNNATTNRINAKLLTAMLKDRGLAAVYIGASDVSADLTIVGRDMRVNVSVEDWGVRAGLATPGRRFTWGFHRSGLVDEDTADDILAFVNERTKPLGK